VLTPIVLCRYPLAYAKMYGIGAATDIGRWMIFAPTTVYEECAFGRRILTSSDRCMTLDAVSDIDV
jgi:hypothetical protein